jgi:hypothetical protein
MGVVLLCIEGLAAVWLMAAAVVAGAGRLRRRGLQFFVAALTLPIPAAPLVEMWIEVQRSDRSASQGVEGTSPMLALLVWTIIVANLGVLVVIVIGLWRRGTPAEPRARAWKPWRLAAAGGTAALLATLTLWTMNNALLSRVAALRAEAGTLALAAAPARPPDHQNAARLYEAASDLIRFAPGDNEKLDAWLSAETLDPEDPARRAFLERHAAALQLIDQAAALPACHFEVSPDQLFGCEGANQVRAAAALVALAARDMAARGNSVEAGLHVGLLFRMANHVAGNPGVMCLLAAAALESRALATLDYVLAAGLVKNEQGRRFTIAMAPTLFRTDLRRVLQTERALVYGRLAGIAEQTSGYGLFFLNDDVAVHQAIFRRLLEEAEKPYPDCLRGWAGVPAEVENLPGILHRTSTPAYAPLLPVVARADASRRVAQLAIAVAVYHIGENRFPARLEEVVPKYLPQIPPDPFTGQPLKMKATADGVVVYSIGPDGVDDGGAPLTEDKPQKGDIRVRIGAKK